MPAARGAGLPNNRQSPPYPISNLREYRLSWGAYPPPEHQTAGLPEREARCGYRTIWAGKRNDAPARGPATYLAAHGLPRREAERRSEAMAERFTNRTRFPAHDAKGAPRNNYAAWWGGLQPAHRFQPVLAGAGLNAPRRLKRDLQNSPLPAETAGSRKSGNVFCWTGKSRPMGRTCSIRILQVPLGTGA